MPSVSDDVSELVCLEAKGNRSACKALIRAYLTTGGVCLCVNMCYGDQTLYLVVPYIL